MGKTIKLIFLGFITGILNGLFGAGGGTIVVPALVFLSGMEDHKAHASAIGVIFPLALISSVMYIRHGIYNIPLTVKVSLGTIAGGILGAILLNKLKSSTLKKIFGFFMIIAAIRMLIA